MHPKTKGIDNDPKVMSIKNNIPEQTFETIERYLLKQMTTEESANFEASLETDTTLQQQVSEVKNLIRGIEKVSLEEKMEEFHSEIETNTLINKKTSSFYRYAIAAVFVGAIGLFFFFNQQSTNEKLFAKHFTPDPGLPTTMSTSDNYAFYEAMVFYKAQDYNTAIKKWELIKTKKPVNDTLNYFLGVANLAYGNGEIAIDYLNIAIANGKSVFSTDAKTYKALALLKVDDTEGAIAILQEVNTPKAKELLLVLKNK